MNTMNGNEVMKTKRKRWKKLDRIKNISVGTDKPKPVKEEKKSKHQDLFDELFGDS